MKKRSVIETVVIALILIFAVVICLYHNSERTIQMDKLWVIAENGLQLVMSLFISFLTVGFVKIFFRWVLAPYFVTKLVYHFSCFASIYILPVKVWSDIWSALCVAVMLAGLIYCLILYKSRK